MREIWFVYERESYESKAPRIYAAFDSFLNASAFILADGEELVPYHDIYPPEGTPSSFESRRYIMKRQSIYTDVETASKDREADKREKALNKLTKEEIRLLGLSR